MSVPFLLRLSSTTDTFDFIANSVKVMDGGFDISMPRANRQLASVRNGSFLLLNTQYEHREAKLKFAVYGATRSEVISRLNKLEKVLRQIESRTNISQGKRGELAYSWEGADQTTYFEVYGGSIAFPEDVLSVAKVHALANGQYILPDVELTLLLSSYGYGISLRSNTLIELPLRNSKTVDKTLGGIAVSHPRVKSAGTSTETDVNPFQCHWVEIDGDDVIGGQPMLTKVLIERSTETNKASEAIYVGLQPYPYPQKLVYPSKGTQTYGYTDQVYSIETHSVAEAGEYTRVITLGHNGATASFRFGGISATSTSGVFSVFLTSGASPFNAYLSLAMQYSVALIDGALGGNYFYSSYRSDFVAPGRTTGCVPLGTLQIPMSNRELSQYGQAIDVGDGSVYIYVAATIPPGYLGNEYSYGALHFLPIGGGMRILRGRSTEMYWRRIVDDGWRGTQYMNRAESAYVYSSVVGMLDTLRLEPGIDQRLYFLKSDVVNDGIPGQAWSGYVTDNFKVRVFGVPTYLTLAM